MGRIADIHFLQKTVLGRDMLRPSNKEPHRNIPTAIHGVQSFFSCEPSNVCTSMGLARTCTLTSDFIILIRFGGCMSCFSYDIPGIHVPLYHFYLVCYICSPLSREHGLDSTQVNVRTTTTLRSSALIMKSFDSQKNAWAQK